jgi:hypothetical protein
MEHENTMWLLLLRDFRHFFDFKTNCSPKLSIKVFNVKRALSMSMHQKPNHILFFYHSLKLDPICGYDHNNGASYRVKVLGCAWLFVCFFWCVVVDALVSRA